MTSHKRKRSLGNTHKVKPKKEIKLKKDAQILDYSPTQELLDETFIAKAIWECLKNNDPEGVMEVIEAHLEAVNKVKASENVELPRATMYNAFKGKKGVPPHRYQDADLHKLTALHYGLIGCAVSLCKDAP